MAPAIQHRQNVLHCVLIKFFVATERSLSHASAVNKVENRDCSFLVCVHDLLSVSQAEVAIQRFVLRSNMAHMTCWHCPSFVLVWCAWYFVWQVIDFVRGFLFLAWLSKEFSCFGFQRELVVWFRSHRSWQDIWCLYWPADTEPSVDCCLSPESS